MIPARVNGRIRATRVRVVDKEGAELGVFPLGAALSLARDRREDLIEIGPEEEPLLCQVMDYGEYRWRLQQQQKDRAHD
jgi:translation initiation factor IF-3